MQKVLEDPQRKACALPTLWRTLGQSPGSYLPSTGERLLPAVEQGKITTCETEGAIQQLGLGNAHIPWQKWIQQTTDTGTTSTQEEQGSTLCSHDASPSVEAGSCSIQGERNILFGNGISTSRVCKGNQRGLSRWQRHAGERQKGCGEARPTEWKTAVFSHEQGHQASGQNQKRDEKPAGCAKQAQVSLDETYEITDRDLDQAGRGIRYPTKGLLQQDPHCTPKYPDCSQRLAEAHSRGCSRSHDRSTGVCNRGGRAHGGGCGCGGRFSAISSARATCEVPENSRSIHSGRNCQRRGKCHGHKCRTSVKTPTFYRAIWLWWQVTLGIDGACLRKDHREPPSQLQEDAGMRAEAYDWYRISCAACSNDSYQPLPLHSKTFNDDECDFPFMALHRAFTLSMQCDTWNHNFNDDIPLTSCTWTLPILKPFRHRVTSKRAVNFSSFVDYFHFPEEEVGDFSHEQHNRTRPDFWIDKSTGTSRPRRCHSTDDHMRSAYDRVCEDQLHNGAPAPQEHALANQPLHIQQLAITHHQLGEFDQRAQEWYINVLSWFIHGQDRRECRNYRRVRLTGAFTTWTAMITEAWRNEIDPQDELHFHVVSPEPPSAEWEDHVAQIILVQEPQHHERATLFTTIFHAPPAMALQRIARFSLQATYLTDCIENAEVPDQVRHRPIEGYYGWQHVQDPPHPATMFRHGASIVLHVRPLPDEPIQQYPFDFLWEDDEYLEQHTRRPRSRSPRRPPRTPPADRGDVTSLLAHQPRVLPLDRQIIQNPDIAQDPEAFANDDDALSEDETSSSTASTYSSTEPTSFAHLFMLRMPMTAARIRIGTSPLMHSSIRYALQLGRHEIQQIHVMEYRPPDLYAANTITALVQRSSDLQPGDNRRIVLVDIVFHEHAAVDISTHRYATTMRKYMTRRVLLEELKIHPYCKAARQQCIVRVNGKLISLSMYAPFDIHHGDYVRVDLPPHHRSQLSTKILACGLRDGLRIRDIQRRFDAGETEVEWEAITAQEDENDEPEDLTNMLQRSLDRRPTAEQVAHTQRPGQGIPIALDDCVSPPNQTTIEFASVQWCAMTLGHIPLELLEEWPSDLQLEAVTIEHLQSIYSPVDFKDCKPEALHFYVDGSKIGEHVGAGIACFIDYEHATVFAGCMSKAVLPAQHAFIGEHAAMMWALIWAIQMSDWISATFSTFEVDISFNFDAMNTGYQTAGIWRAVEHTNWKAALRSLAHVLQRRHTHQRLTWMHVKAHSQHPRNELVDQLAKYAALHPEQVPGCAAWMPWITDGQYRTELPWIWYYEHLLTSPHDAPQLHGTVMTSQAQTIDQYDHTGSLHSQYTKRSKQHPLQQFDITLATVNVLTLATEDHFGRISPTKQQLLMQQFVRANCAVVGLQETRHKKIIDPNNPHFHIVGHPCDHLGHDGVQLWFAKNLPLHPNGSHILLKHLKILTSSPTFLAVKLEMPGWKCVFVTGRAPHSGHDDVHNEKFWANISSAIRQYTSQMPLFFLGDTNGHLGEHVTAAVGDHGAVTENAPGKQFHDWILEHGLWLPCTFAAHHDGGRHSTFVTPNGEHESRIDYIAIPTCIHFHEVTTWVAEDLELGGARIDHLATMCHCKYAIDASSDNKGKQLRETNGSMFGLAESLRDPQAAQALQKYLCNPSWYLDPHRSADHLAQQTQQALQTLAPRNQIWRRKRHVPDEVWSLVDGKKKLFRQLKTLRQNQRHTMMQTLFGAWKSTSTSTPPADAHDPWLWMKMMDHSIAQCMSTL